MKQTITAMPHANSLKHNPSYRETADVLREHLRKQQQFRKQSSFPLTTSDIKRDAAQILDEFLKQEFLKQELSKVSKVHPILDSEYQRVEEEDIVISELPSKRTSTNSWDSKQSAKSAKISIYSLTQDDIDLPFADDDVDTEHEVPEKSQSLPSSINYSVNPNKLPARSARSLSPSSSTKIEKPGKHVTPQIDVVNPPSADKNSRSSRSKSTTPRSDVVEEEDFDRRRKRHRSGSISSEDTDGSEVISPDRKKKSIFKRAKERLNSFIQRKRSQQRKDSRKDQENEREKPKKKRNRAKSDKKDSLVLTERQTHKSGHIEQHRIKNGDQTGIFRSEETWESTDITDKERNHQRHIDRHKNVKESTDLSNSSGGIFGTLKRLSLKKSKRDKSKSLTDVDHSKIVHQKQSSGDSYDKSVSLFDGDKKYDLHLHTERERTDSNSKSHIHSTRVITSERDYIEAGDEIGQIPPRSLTDRNKYSNKDIAGSGRVVKDRPLSGESPGLNDISERREDRIVRRDSGLEKSDSFTIDYELDETVKTTKHKDGSIDIDSDKHVHQRIHGTSDLEIDGLDDIDGHRFIAAGGDQKDEKNEKIIGEIANRIAEIGDSYVHNGPRSDSESGSPVASSSGQHMLSASSSSRDGEGLNSLERELRDYLRAFGDNISKKVEVSGQATEAAKEMARQSTYIVFKDTVKRTIGDDVSWDQLAMLFYLTKKGIQLAGAGGAVAVQIKENCLRYVEDKFAKWIVGQGGWDSVLTDTETSTDSELD